MLQVSWLGLLCMLLLLLFRIYYVVKFSSQANKQNRASSDTCSMAIFLGSGPPNCSTVKALVDHGYRWPYKWNAGINYFSGSLSLYSPYIYNQWRRCLECSEGGWIWTCSKRTKVPRSSSVNAHPETFCRSAIMNTLLNRCPVQEEFINPCLAHLSQHYGPLYFVSNWYTITQRRETGHLRMFYWWMGRVHVSCSALLSWAAG